MWNYKMLFNKGLEAGIGVVLAAAILKFITSAPRSFIQEPLDSYDYIIVGGGSTGGVLAARLSKNYSVLLVEAGGQFGWLASVPLAAPFLQGTDNDWQFRTLPQKHSSFGLVQQISLWPCGKGLGGSGQMNYLVHYPGSKEDWKAFSTFGLQGWTHDTMVHYTAKLRGKPYRNEMFKVVFPLCAENELVTCSPAQCHVNVSKLLLRSTHKNPNSQKPSLHATTSRQVYTHKPSIVLSKKSSYDDVILHSLLSAAKELGHLRLSVTPGQSTVRSGKRWTSLQSHLLPAVGHDRLHVLLHRRATRVLFRGRTAHGVQIGDRPVNVKREVVLCAGAVSTPHLLQLSGVGPRALLEKYGIDVVADLPVGMNLHDHLNVPLYVSLGKPVSLTISKVLRISQILKYAMFGKGPFAGTPVVGTVVSGDAGLLFLGIGSIEEKLFRVISNYKSKVFDAVFPDHRNHSAEGIVILCSCLRPKSRGLVQIKSKNPGLLPDIQPQYLHNFYDIACTKQAIRLARRLLLTTPFQRLRARLHLPVLEECLEYEPSINDDYYLECLVRTVGITGHHPGGTVSMGNLAHSVLDSAFRINNISGLRVVDASVLPIPVLGSPHSILMAMAERAASMISAEANSLLGSVLQ